MIKFDQHDILLTVGAVRSRGLWAAEMKTGKFPSRRTAGRLSQSASAHSLLGVAVIANLRAVSNRIASILAEDSKRRKPVVSITSTDAAFLD